MGNSFNFLLSLVLPWKQRTPQSFLIGLVREINNPQALIALKRLNVD
jgi:hypothetical protein